MHLLFLLSLPCPWHSTGHKFRIQSTNWLWYTVMNLKSFWVCFTLSQYLNTFLSPSYSLLHYSLWLTNRFFFCICVSYSPSFSSSWRQEGACYINVREWIKFFIGGFVLEIHLQLSGVQSVPERENWWLSWLHWRGVFCGGKQGKKNGPREENLTWRQAYGKGERHIDGEKGYIHCLVQTPGLGLISGKKERYRCYAVNSLSSILKDAESEDLSRAPFWPR